GRAAVAGGGVGTPRWRTRRAAAGAPRSTGGCPLLLWLPGTRQRERSAADGAAPGAAPAPGGSGVGAVGREFPALCGAARRLAAWAHAQRAEPTGRTAVRRRGAPVPGGPARGRPGL